MSIRAVGLFMLLILLICVACSGCVAHAHSHGDEDIALTALWTLGGIAVGMAVMFLLFGEWVDEGLKPALILLATAALLFLCGCSALPMPLQPETQNNSNYAEGAFIVLAAVDTAQTMHIRKGTSCDHEADPIAVALYGSRYPKPGRVLLTNLALITVHTTVTSWLDDKVVEHAQANDDSVGPWYVGRVVWHGASLLVESSAVINNRARGCAL